ncbi:hypothetical protein L1049_013740 [Liquidambar formosana]|uniref:Uncharacterized protein n=1 Tax=Liquidambar formosana TaxID=63359 RepID=A0AAP0RPS5_LIQFO
MKIVSSFFKFLKHSGVRGKQKQHMRVADVLVSDDDEEIDGYNGGHSIMAAGRRKNREERMTFECVSPWVILSRWLSSLSRSRKRMGLRREKERRRERVGGESGGGSMRIKCSTNVLSGESSSSLRLEGCKGGSEMVDESGLYRKDNSFNLGVGFGLLFLITASKNELNKMMELRTQMEMLLQNVKEELRRKDTLSKPSESSNNIAYSTTDVEESVNTNGHLSIQNNTPSLILPHLETMIHDQTLKYNMSREEECVGGMDQLEAELEAELERLQLHLDAEYLSKCPKQQRLE